MSGKLLSCHLYSRTIYMIVITQKLTSAKNFQYLKSKREIAFYVRLPLNENMSTNVKLRNLFISFLQKFGEYIKMIPSKH